MQGPPPRPLNTEAALPCGLASLTEEAVRAGVMPGGVIALRRAAAGGGWLIAPFGRLGTTRDAGPAVPEAVYDLASVTKIMSTAFLAMLARDRGLVPDLDLPLAAYGWEGPPDTVSLTVRNLLAHRSGLPAWRPLYLAGGGPRGERAAMAKKAVLNERPLFPQGERTLYSDLGFVLLGLLLEELMGAPVNALFRAEVARPLGLGRALFSPGRADGIEPGQAAPVAPTEDGFRKGGPLDFPGVPFLGPVPPGRAHDDNAAWLGGAAGHAGLFASALDVSLAVESWTVSFQGRGGLVSEGTAREFMDTGLEGAPARQGPARQGPSRQVPAPGGAPDAARALGFDVLARPAGRPALLGHKGYTGPAVWFDPAGLDAVVLLCNRVHPTARRGGMDAFRARLVELAFPG